MRRRDPSLGRLSRGVRGQMGYDACDVSLLLSDRGGREERGFVDMPLIARSCFWG